MLDDLPAHSTLPPPVSIQPLPTTGAMPSSLEPPPPHNHSHIPMEAILPQITTQRHQCSHRHEHASKQAQPDDDLPPPLARRCDSNSEDNDHDDSTTTTITSVTTETTPTLLLASPPSPQNTALRYQRRQACQHNSQHGSLTHTP